MTADVASMESVSVRHDDGAIDTLQRAPLDARADAGDLERLYWNEIRRATFGAARFGRGAIRVAGVGPALLRFGPLENGHREIVGGWFASKPGGTISWSADGSETSVAVRGFRPLLGGPLWRLQAWLHDRIGRRYLSRVAREAR